MSENIVKTWFSKSQTESQEFDKCIALWISFNAFYSGYTLSPDDKINERYRDSLKNKKGEIDFRKDGDKKMREFVIGDFKNDFKNDFHKYDINNNISIFFDYLQRREHVKDGHVLAGGILKFRKYILEESINSEEDTKSYCEIYDNKDDLRKFINIIYTIRCNLIHGGKCLDDLYSKELIGYANHAFYDFLKVIYLKVIYSEVLY